MEKTSKETLKHIFTANDKKKFTKYKQTATSTN